MPPCPETDAMLQDLQHSLSAGTIRLHYQPIVRLATSELHAAEALMRWTRPGFGEVTPSVFIPLAEQAGLISELGAWSLDQACRDAVTWPDDLSVAVNLSVRQLGGPDTFDAVRSALRRSGLNPRRLTLEVTETGLLTDSADTIGHLDALVSLGVRLALDDFGTGNSSFNYLRDLPIEQIKIDRSFVAGLSRNIDDSAIVATVLDLAAKLQLCAVAEGVENTKQLAALRILGCPLGQGYLWSPAVPAASLPQSSSAIPQLAITDHADGQTSSDIVLYDPATAGRIFAMHREGTYPATIAAALNREGLPSPTAERWTRNEVARLLKELLT